MLTMNLSCKGIDCIKKEECVHYIWEQKYPRADNLSHEKSKIESDGTCIWFCEYKEKKECD